MPVHFTSIDRHCRSNSIRKKKMTYKFGYLHLVPLFKSVDWHIKLPHCVSACNMCLWQASLD